MRLSSSSTVMATVRRPIIYAGNRFVYRVSNSGLVIGPTDYTVDSIQTILTLGKAKMAILEGKGVEVGFNKLKRLVYTAYAQQSSYLRRPRHLRETPR